MANENLMILKSYVEISSYRKKAVNAIGDNYKIPTQIASDCGIRPNHISKVLKELKDHELAECINEEARKGRVYKLTRKGKQIWRMIK